MINYFCFFCYCCLSLLFFSTSVRSGSTNNNRQQTTDNSEQIQYLKTNEIRDVIPSRLNNQENSQSQIDTDHFSNSIDHSNFITGLWRGFHEYDGLQVYYGYQFLANGSFVGRHRIYQNQQTIEDITLQGEWQFQDNILTIKGFNLKYKNKQATLKFKLTDTFKLAYETGSLSDFYQGIVLNKIGY
ncbi:hypothetical protein [Crocosphaera sp.]|uniref:hypothetical protein n=1 Tax=Crocosphaera sp. TaxID=2729996 RepID=UPI003F2666EA|nr:hypothetical protein [Crocosphaera sp.]